MNESLDSELEQPYASLIAWQRSVTVTLAVLQKDVKSNARLNRAHAKHLSELNGSLAALKEVEKITPKLQDIVEKLSPEIMDKILGLAEEKAEEEAFRRGVKKRLRWFTPIRIFSGSIFLAIVSGVAYEATKFAFTGHF